MNRLLIKQIDIPQPCNQSWQQMEQNEHGRYCMHCSKTVVDFESMTDAHLIAYLTTHNDVCGRLSESQLNRVNLQLNERHSQPKTGLKKWLMTAALFGSTAMCKVSGQSTTVAMPKVEQSLSGAYSNNFPLRKMVSNNEYKRQIKGQVFDGTNTPLYGATISVLGTNIALSTDSAGRFKFQAPISAKEFTVSFVGFKTETINIDSLQNDVADVKMTALVVALNNSIVITGYPTRRCTSIVGSIATVTIKKRCWLWRMYYKYIRTPIHQIFY